MDALIIPFYLFSRPCLHPATRGSLRASLCELRPDKSFVRQTQTRLRQGYAAAGRTQKFCLRDPPSHIAMSRQACGGKNINRLAILSMLMPERHEAFAWAGRPGKTFLLSAYCLRVSAVKIFTYLSHTTGIIGSFH